MVGAGVVLGFVFMFGYVVGKYVESQRGKRISKTLQ
jgi:hypothetical protein